MRRQRQVESSWNADLRPYVRWDAYKAIGYPEIKDLDGLLDVMKQMQEAVPTSDSGKPTYAMSFFKDWDGNMMNNAKQPTCYYGYDELGFVLAKADGSDYQDITDSDSIYMDVLEFFYKANQMGLVDPESTTQNYDTMYSKYQDGQILFSFWPWLGQVHTTPPSIKRKARDSCWRISTTCRSSHTAASRTETLRTVL